MYLNDLVLLQPTLYTHLVIFSTVTFFHHTNVYCLYGIIYHYDYKVMKLAHSTDLVYKQDEEGYDYWLYQLNLSLTFLLL